MQMVKLIEHIDRKQARGQEGRWGKKTPMGGIRVHANNENTFATTNA